MKIVIIANNSNGLYLFRRQLIQALIEKGHKVIILTPFDADVDNLKLIGAELIETPIERRETNLLKDLALLKRYKKELRYIRPELVITYTIKPNIYGGFVCSYYRIPYAPNITGLGTAFEHDGFLRKFVIILYTHALKKAKVVFFENNSNRDCFIKERIVRQEKTYVLNGAGVDLEHFYYQPYPENRVFRFLFIGRVMKEKGMGELLQAMNELVLDGFECFIDILGDYEEDYKERLERAEKSGWLKYHGNQADVRPFIKKCDCFVLPSYHEGMANTNLECASSGRPIITSAIPGCREAVLDGVSGLLCEPHNTESLIDKMKHMMRINRMEREKMGRQGRQYMAEKFDKRIVVRETIQQLLSD